MSTRIYPQSGDNLNISKTLFVGPDTSKEFEFSSNKAEFNEDDSPPTLGTEMAPGLLICFGQNNEDQIHSSNIQLATLRITNTIIRSTEKKMSVVY